MGNGAGTLGVSPMLTKEGNATSISKNVISFYVFAADIQGFTILHTGVENTGIVCFNHFPNLQQSGRYQFHGSEDSLWNEIGW